MNRRALLFGMAATPGLAAMGFGRPARGAMTASLSTAATEKGRYFGTAVRIDQIEANPRLRQAVLNDCGFLTPEIHMKWNALQPARDQWTPGPADGLVRFAQANNLRVRGHALLWHKSTPQWAEAEIARERDWSTVGRYIEAVAGRYRDHVEEWDVVNEPIDADGSTDGLRDNVFMRSYGSSYIARALEAARAAAPKARLAINDYSFEYDNSTEQVRRTAFLKLLEKLKAAGTPLDSVGLQAHLDLSKGPLKPGILKPFLAEIAGMGLDIAITELDVNEHDRRLSLRERDARVADEVRRYLDIVLDEPKVKGVTTWGLSDEHSWLQAAGARGAALNRGLPYDAVLEPKPMHRAIHASLLA